MKVLHIFKSRPDGMVSDIVKQTCQQDDCGFIETFQENVDWDDVVDKLFAADKVICWW